MIELRPLAPDDRKQVRTTTSSGGLRIALLYGGSARKPEAQKGFRFPALKDGIRAER